MTGQNETSKSHDPPARANVIKYQSCKPASKTKKAEKSKDSNINQTTSKSQVPYQKQTYVPDTNFTLACLVCMCFNLPLGVVAMYMSLSAARAYRDNEPLKGRRRARCSVFISLLSIVSTVLVVMTMVLYVVIQNQRNRLERGYPP